MMATLAILIAASTITANASSKHDNNGRHNNDNVAMMNNDYDRHNDGDRVYNGGRHHSVYSGRYPFTNSGDTRSLRR